MKRIPVYCKDKVIGHAKVDDYNFEWLNQWQWFNCNGYAYRKQKGVSRYMHRVILGEKRKTRTDHINGDKLDNQRKNLRACTASQNAINVIKYRRKSHSKYKGVSLHKKSGRWRARLRFKKTEIFIGYFDSEVAAAAAYNKSAKKHFGNFAKANVL